MSGLLVKSTVVMKENLEEMNSRGVAAQWPVILGGAALTRAYVENDLAELYDGEVRYARDAFEGLRLMDALVAVRRGVARRAAAGAAASAGSVRAAGDGRRVGRTPEDVPARSDVAADNAVPDAAVLGRPHRQGRRARRLRRRTSTSAPRSWGSGG